MLEDLLLRVSHVDEFFTELQSILCILPGKEREKAEKLLRDQAYYFTLEEISNDLNT